MAVDVLVDVLVGDDVDVFVGVDVEDGVGVDVVVEVLVLVGDGV